MNRLALRKITLSHFRSHKASEIYFQNGIIVIVGENGSGKTNILEAISLLAPGRGFRSSNSRELRRIPEDVGWKIMADLDSFGQLYEIITTVKDQNFRKVIIDGENSSQVKLGRLLKILWLTPSMDRIWSEGASGRRKFLDRLVLNFEPGHAENSIRYSKALNQRNRLIKDQNFDKVWLASIESQMAESGYAIQTARNKALLRLNLEQNSSEREFPISKLSMSSEYFPSVEHLKNGLLESRRKDFLSGRSLIGPHKADLLVEHVSKGIMAKSCSTGEQKSLLISIILASARAQKQDFGSSPILLLDEAAAHLDEVSRKKLYNELISLESQVFLTGTNVDNFGGLRGRCQSIQVDYFEEESSVKELDFC